MDPTNDLIEWYYCQLKTMLITLMSKSNFLYNPVGMVEFIITPSINNNTESN